MVERQHTRERASQACARYRPLHRQWGCVSRSREAYGLFRAQPGFGCLAHAGARCGACAASGAARVSRGTYVSDWQEADDDFPEHAKVHEVPQVAEHEFRFALLRCVIQLQEENRGDGVALLHHEPQVLVYRVCANVGALLDVRKVRHGHRLPPVRQNAHEVQMNQPQILGGVVLFCQVRQPVRALVRPVHDHRQVRVGVVCGHQSARVVGLQFRLDVFVVLTQLNPQFFQGRTRIRQCTPLPQPHARAALGKFQVLADLDVRGPCPPAGVEVGLYAAEYSLPLAVDLV